MFADVFVKKRSPSCCICMPRMTFRVQRLVTTDPIPLLYSYVRQAHISSLPEKREELSGTRFGVSVLVLKAEAGFLSEADVTMFIP